MSAATLVAVFAEARAIGLLGPGDPGAHLDHSRSVAELIGSPPRRFLDLGSGAGVPGLVLAVEWTTVEGVLLDAAERRCEFLARAVATLGLSERVTVRCGRAEDLARDPVLRGAFPLVVARSFGAPPVVAECAVGFLAQEGRLIVTEPPVTAPNAARWPSESLAMLGLGPAERLRAGDVGAVAMTRTGELSDRWPRRVGVPRKRPLW